VGLALFIGQAFLYNAVTFDLGTLLNEFYNVGSQSVPYFMVVFAVSNFLGPLLLGRYFDTVGRVPMIAGTYLGSAALVTLLGILLLNGSLGKWGFMALVLATFFLASAGASSAYLTVSEVFPMETRALAIALFFAVGTAVGGIAGPALFGQFIHSGDADLVALGFFIGAAAMALGGIAELLWGVRAEQRSLEDIAEPLTAVDEEPAPRSAGERDARILARTERMRDHQRAGLRRLRPGPGTSFYSPAMVGSGTTDSRYTEAVALDFDREIAAVVLVLAEAGPLSRDELATRLGARGWGPGRYRRALREAVREGGAVRVASGRYGPPEQA
jgi:MFS family permease